jgi:nitrate reductase gamma subunit
MFFVFYTLIPYVLICPKLNKLNLNLSVKRFNWKKKKVDEKKCATVNVISILVYIIIIIFKYVTMIIIL